LMEFGGADCNWKCEGMIGTRERWGLRALTFFSLGLLFCGDEFSLIHDPGGDAPKSS
jgi:hypothetical protein